MRRSLRLGFGNPKLGFRSLVSVEVDATKLAWRLGFGNPKLRFRSLDSVEADATKPEAWIRKPEAWIPKLGFQSLDSVEVYATKPAWRCRYRGDANDNLASYRT